MALSSLIFEKTFKSEPVPDMTPESFELPRVCGEAELGFCTIKGHMILGSRLCAAIRLRFARRG